MALTRADELPHEPPDPCPQRWQENYFFLGWSATHEAGFAVHVERFPARGVVELKTAIALGGELVSLTTHSALTPELSVAGLDLEVVEPFRRWRLGHRGRGGRGRGPLGFVALAEHGDVPFALDLTIDAGLDVIDHREALRQLPIPGIETDHYEVPGSWSGSLAVGERRVEADGLFVRDHTWGARDYSRFASAWWVPSWFPSATTYVCGGLVDYQGSWVGFGLVADGGEVVATTDVELATTGTVGPTGYDSTTLRVRPPRGDERVVESRSALHLPHYFPGFAPGHYCNDTLSELSMDGQVGFGVRELNSHLTEAEIAQVEAAIT